MFVASFRDVVERKARCVLCALSQSGKFRVGEDVDGNDDWDEEDDLRCSDVRLPLTIPRTFVEELDPVVEGESGIVDFVRCSLCSFWYFQDEYGVIDSSPLSSTMEQTNLESVVSSNLNWTIAISQPYCGCL